MLKKAPLSIAIASSLLSLPVIIQAAETKAQSEKLEEVFVTGSKEAYKVNRSTGAMRMEASPLETPGQLAVINEELMKQQHASKLLDVLENDASISSGSKHRNRQRYSLRGFSLSSSSGFLRDGKQHWSHYEQPVEILERVEVLKGPSGLLYGKSAPGGLINMVSKKPTAEKQFSLTQELGSGNHSRTVVDASGALNQSGSLRARAIGAKKSADSWRRYNDGSTPSLERDVRALFLDWDITSNLTLSLHYDYTKDDGSVDSGAYIKDGKPVLGEKFIWDAQWSNIQNKVENKGFDINWDINSSWNMSAGYNVQNFLRRDVESFSRPKTYDPALGTFTYNGYDRYDDWVFKTAYVDFVGEFDTAGVSHQLLIGFNYLNYFYQRQAQYLRNFTANLGMPMPKPANLHYLNAQQSTPSKRDSYGLYLQDMITFNEQWQLLLGVRVDVEDKKGTANSAGEKQTNTLPKAAVIFHPSNNSSLYLTYSESFEPQEKVSSPTDANFGKELDPVTGKLYELGTKWELFEERLLISGAIFRITQENKVLVESISPALPGGIDSRTTQIGEQIHDGIELSVNGHINEQFSLLGSITYLDAEIKDPLNQTTNNKRPQDVPEYSASLWGQYNLSERTSANLGGIYQGARFGNSGERYKKPGYTRVDASVAHVVNAGETDITLRFSIENVFDKFYLNGGDDDNTVIGRGRNYMASATIDF